MNKLCPNENDSIQLSHYLEFKEICDYHRNFHDDYSTFDEFTAKHKEDFFNDNLRVFSKYVYLLQFVGNNHFRDMNINYTLFGVAYEYLLKICALKINWDEYLELYKSNRKNRMFEFAKKYVLKDLKNKLTPEQHNRSIELLNFIQLQRNHFAHNPFKGMDHYGVTKQIYDFMAVLIVIYKLKLPKETIATINNNIGKYKVHSGMDFKDVGFGEYIDHLNEYAIDIPVIEANW